MIDEQTPQQALQAKPGNSTGTPSAAQNQPPNNASMQYNQPSERSNQSPSVGNQPQTQRQPAPAQGAQAKPQNLPPSSDQAPYQAVPQNQEATQEKRPPLQPTQAPQQNQPSPPPAAHGKQQQPSTAPPSRQTGHSSPPPSQTPQQPHTTPQAQPVTASQAEHAAGRGSVGHTPNPPAPEQPKAQQPAATPDASRPDNPAETSGATPAPPNREGGMFSQGPQAPEQRASGASRISSEGKEVSGSGNELVVQDFSTDITQRQASDLEHRKSNDIQQGRSGEVKEKEGTDVGDAKKSKARMPLGERLISKGLVSRDQLEVALKVQQESEDKPMIGQILVQLGFITESALGELLTEHSDIERFDPKSTIIDPNLIKQVPKDIAERYKAAPILLSGEKVYVAIHDIYNVIAIDRIQRYFPKRFKMVPVHCSESDLLEIIDNYYDYELSIDGILREMEALRNDEEELTKLNDQDNYTNPTVRLIDSLLVDAIRAGASDIHFEPEGSFVRLRYRIDGTLRLIRSFHKDYWSAIVVRVKIMSDMNITESRLPQDGRITLHVLGREISFRVATQPTIHGENLVLRILDKKKALLPMNVLGYSEENLRLLEIALKRPEGVIIVTGPTGSGKSTTLYSILQYINKPEVNIMTLEDPVEYELPMIRQSNIREGTGMDFVSGIKSLMRQDPDIIFVGEVRDIDTATMAMRAAMTGHQVYTSLHTNDALGALPRLIDIGVKPEMLASNIICSIAQRLARKLCNECKEEYTPDEEERSILGLEKDDTSTKLYRHVGCDRCDYTGYKGRIAVSEVILVDAGLDEMIFRKAPKSEMLSHIKTKGFIPMAEDGIRKVLKGLIDLDELARTIDITDRL